MLGPHRTPVDRLHHLGTSPVHRLAAAPKLVGLVAFVVAVALTPRRSVAVLLADAAVLAVVVALARLPLRLVLVRLAAVVPFVAFALVLPFLGTGERTEVLGASVSIDGLWAAWNLLAKAALGATAAIVVTATTPVPDLLAGLDRLRLPRVVVAIIASMIRYLDLVADELARSRRAMTARGHDPRWLWQVGPIASSLGSLFVRTYERGERVHLAMVARGFTGTMPVVAPPERLRTTAVAAALAPGALALSLLVLGSVAS